MKNGGAAALSCRAVQGPLGSYSGYVLVWSYQYRLATSSDVVRAGRRFCLARGNVAWMCVRSLGTIDTNTTGSATHPDGSPGPVPLLMQPDPPRTRLIGPISSSVCFLPATREHSDQSTPSAGMHGENQRQDHDETPVQDELPDYE